MRAVSLPTLISIEINGLRIVRRRAVLISIDRFRENGLTSAVTSRPM